MHFDIGRNEVIEVDRPRRRAAARRARAATTPTTIGPLRTDLKPLEITQPEGPSFTVDGNLVRWQKWSFRVGSTRTRASCCTRSRYDDGGRVRPILHRASISEMVVPYGDPGPMHGWKNAFDAGEWGLGRMTQLAHARLRLPRRDPLLRRDARRPSRASRTSIENAICMHEEDYGILWKHVDLHGGTQRGPPQPAARRQLRSRPSATTSTASSGTSTSTATSSSR